MSCDVSHLGPGFGCENIRHQVNACYPIKVMSQEVCFVVSSIGTDMLITREIVKWYRTTASMVLQSSVENISERRWCIH